MELDAPVVADLDLLDQLLRPAAASGTVGTLAAAARELAAQPERWWHVVRFDPAAPVTVELPGERGAAAAMRLIAWPPGHRAIHRPEGAADEVVSVLAGELHERIVTAAGVRSFVLRPGRLRVHGRAHIRELANPGPVYAVSLHAFGPGRPAAADTLSGP